MSPYPAAETWTFSLESIGAPELEIVCTEPRSVSVREQRRLQQAQMILQRYMIRGEVPPAEQDWTLQAMDDLLRKTVRSWNLPYPEDHPRKGQVIPLNDPEAEADPFGALPGEVYQVVVQEVGKRLLLPPKRPTG